jgi:hypothetical protein
MKQWQFIYAVRNTTARTSDSIFQLEAIVPPFFLFLFDVFDDISIQNVRDARFKFFTVV